MSAENEIKKSAEEAVRVEEEALAGENNGVYTHVFKTPFTFEDNTYDELTFDWNSLSGNDSIAVEDELLAKGKTLVTPEFNSSYLVGMAARACTYREDGRRKVSRYTISAMPVADFRRICNELRSFLLRAGR